MPLLACPAGYVRRSQRLQVETARRGAALLVCIFVAGLTTAMAVAMLSVQTSQMSAARNVADHERALHLAGAAIHHSLAELEADFSWRTGIASTEFPSGSGYTYSSTVVDGAADTVLITGTGVAGNVTRRLQVTIQQVN